MKQSPLAKVGEKARKWQARDKAVKRECREIGYCEHCGATIGLEAHHLISIARSFALRWYRENLICLCWKCHRYAHDKPADFRTWMDKTFPGRMEELDRLCNQGGNLECQP